MFEGMDVEIIHTIGLQLKAEAGELRSTMCAVDGTVSQAMSSWHGVDASGFATAWNGHHRPSLDRAAAALDDLAGVALVNGDEQQRTSSASESPAAAVIGASAALGSAFAAQLSTVNNILGVPDLVRRWNGVLSRVRVTRGLVSGVDDQLAKVTKSLDSMTNDVRHAGSYRFISDIGRGVTDKLGRFGLGITELQHGSVIVSDLRRGQIGSGIGEAATGLADGLKSSKNPTAYLAGFDLALWKDVVNAGIEDNRAHWLRGVPPPTSVQGITDVWIPAMRATGTEFIQKAKGWLM